MILLLNCAYNREVCQSVLSVWESVQKLGKWAKNWKTLAKAKKL